MRSDLFRVDEGRGTPVVFVHGANGDARTHEALRAPVAGACRYVSYSRRFHWPQADPPGPGEYTLARHVADLLDLLAALDAGPVHLVGQSYGSFVAALAARAAPERVRTLTLGETIFGALMADDAAAAPLLAAFGAALKPIAALAATAPREASAGLFDLVNDQPGAFDRFEPSQRAVWLDNAHTLAGTMSERRVDFGPADLPALAMPVLAIGGARSAPVYRAAWRAIARHLPDGGKAISVPDAGHLWMHDAPAAATRALLEHFAKGR